MSVSLHWGYISYIAHHSIYEDIIHQKKPLRHNFDTKINTYFIGFIIGMVVERASHKKDT